MASKSLMETSQAIASANLASGLHAALTIAARSQAFLSPLSEPFEKAGEAYRMVAEKVDAAVEGALAAQAAWGEFVIRAAFGDVRSAADVSVGLVGVAEAASGPARRKVRANARRLTGF